MGQMGFSVAEYAGKRKKTRREVFLEEMEQVVPWKAQTCRHRSRRREPAGLTSSRSHVVQPFPRTWRC